MRELYVVGSESTESSVVLSTDPTNPDDGERFFFAVTDELRTALLGDTAEPEAPAEEPAAAPAYARREPQQLSEPDPLLTTPLSMRPAEIQDRIRSGATVSELAEEMGVAESRVEPFAHPVLQERARFAALGRGAHPVRDNGPARLSLEAILATAFAARGLDIEDASWDAYRNEQRQWTVVVRWSVGQSDNTATWTIQNHMTSSPTALPSNELAAELTDPERSSSPRPVASVTPRSDDDTRDLPRIVPLNETPPADEEPREENDEDLLQHPEAEEKPKKRRKTVTPHWEDVLLGVRSNTKRPRK
ncbi:septation protein SepH [Corynebacterium renale]|uniref:septation protein SepH n=1 Tax=Corynebacterium renale TaxID=1724 RepID=UPI000654841C|nr:septation protein SepH [Corynebacterium renale]